MIDPRNNPEYECLHDEVRFGEPGYTCTNKKHYEDCDVHECPTCGEQIHTNPDKASLPTRKTCTHNHFSRSWEECEKPSHGEACTVGICDGCGAVTSHDYGIEAFMGENGQNGASLGEILTNGSGEGALGDSTPPGYARKDSAMIGQQFRDIIFKNSTPEELKKLRGEK